MLRVAEREEAGDGDRLWGPRAHGSHDAPELGVPERRDHPGRPHALRHPHDIVTVNQRRGMVPSEVVQGGAVLAAQPQHVLEAARRHEHHACTAALEQRIRRERRAVDEQLDGRSCPEELERPEHAGHRVVWGRDDLTHVERSVVAQRHEVGECAAHVDADPWHQRRPRSS